MIHPYSDIDLSPRNPARDFAVQRFGESLRRRRRIIPSCARAIFLCFCPFATWSGFLQSFCTSDTAGHSARPLQVFRAAEISRICHGAAAAFCHGYFKKSYSSNESMCCGAAARRQTMDVLFLNSAQVKLRNDHWAFGYTFSPFIKIFLIIFHRGV